jgi:sterol desaturase/sphingolipid hydroxylase (fatty acid hydroxylase superfamily)
VIKDSTLRYKEQCNIFVALAAGEHQWILAILFIIHKITLQGALPLLLSTAIVRPHPLTAYAYTIWRLAENVVNHSGLESTLLNVLFLKFLPGRASVSHHDYHHKFSNYSGNAKNYAEFFWIWDYLFGTLSTPAKSD